jgi:DNA polymerase II large subunit
MNLYFSQLQEDCKACYTVAKEARAKGFDPEIDVEIPPAEDLASRVENLVGPVGIAQKIRDMTKSQSSREMVAILIAKDIVKTGDFRTKDEAMDQAVRTGLAIITEGVLVAPLEGVSEVSIRQNDDGSDYLKIGFAGPIRSAGGTGQAVGVLIADVVRREMGIGRFKVRKNEIERYKEEFHLRKTSQYKPKDEEIENIVKNCAICLDGDGTEKKEVSGYRNLERVQTNQVRGGLCLVMAEGLCQKAKKIKKLVDALGIEGWDFISKLIKKEKKIEKKGPTTIFDYQPSPKTKYLRDVIAGRPVLSLPSAIGGFRLRYGRGRTCGLAAIAIHPASMFVAGEFLAVGTQVKIEFPGKAGAITPCDSIEGPIVELHNGSLMQVSSADQAKELKKKIARIIDLGEVLIPFGEFSENNHILMPPSFANEWWQQLLEIKLMEAGVGSEDTSDISRRMLDTNFSNSYLLSKHYGIPLNPAFNLFYHDLPPETLHFLGGFISERGTIIGSSDLPSTILPDASELERMAGETEESLRLEIKTDEGAGSIAAKEILCVLGALHETRENTIILAKYGEALTRCLGLTVGENGKISKSDEWESVFSDNQVKIDDEKVVGEWGPKKEIKYEDESHYLKVNDNKYWGDTLKLMGRLSGIDIYPRAPTRVGARMARPEKAHERKMKPAVHCLFPLGAAGTDRRSLKKANEVRRFSADVGRRTCPECGKFTFRYICPGCNTHTIHKGEVVIEKKILDFYTIYGEARKNIGMGSPPEAKGVKGLMSKFKTPEPLEKGLLRAKNEVFVFKDGTIRFDMTDVPLTHFRPREIHTPFQKLRELGYTHDMDGRELESDEQLLELKVQDILCSRRGMDYFFRATHFIDELLVRFYKLPAFYNLEKAADLVGHLVVGLAPHTSGGVLGRIIGHGNARVGYAHPFYHAAKRRNCLSGDTKVLLSDGTSSTLKGLFENAVSSIRAVDDVGTEMKDITGPEVISMEPSGGPLRRETIKNVIRTPSPDNWIEIRTRGGRHITASPYHQLFIHDHDNTKLSRMRAHSVKIGDSLVVPGHVDIGVENTDRIDLFDVLVKASVPDVMIRNTDGWMIETIIAAGGYKVVEDTLGMKGKALTNYAYRDSYPLEIAVRIAALTGKDLADMPLSVKLAAKWDTVEMKRFIEVNSEFCRFLGYYIAEGFCRISRGSFYQIGLSSSEKDIREDIVRCIKSAFGINPSLRGDVITLSGRLIAFLMRDIWKTGSRALDKRIPESFRRLPLSKIAHLLAAYMAGDGHVEKGRLTVKATSANLNLLRDIQLQLKRFGIHSKFRHERRRGGGVVREFYASRGKITPFFDSHSLIIRSTDARLFHDLVGIASKRKMDALKEVLPKERGRRAGRFGKHFLDPVSEVRMVAARDKHVYDIEVANTHSFLTEDLLVTSNCDGDEDCLMLLLDGLLNFSKSYLPGTIGGQMDAPLVLSTRLDPSEIDKEAHNIDVLNRYPVEFFDAAVRQESPKEVDDIMDKVAARISFPAQYEGFGFTHDTKDISEGITTTAYKTLGSMDAKINGQLNLATKIRAVNDSFVAAKVIESHFMPDMMGNMNAFSRQKMKCSACGMSFRRPPIKGACLSCGSKKLHLTVHRGMVEKYIKTSKKIAERYDLPEYTVQRIELIEKAMESLFNNDKVKQTGLWDFC